MNGLTNKWKKKREYRGRKEGGGKEKGLIKISWKKNSERNRGLLNLLEGHRSEKKHWYTRKIFTFTVSISSQ